ncbi:hypothetical protein [Clostridium botulinum]|uniref:hypothetical protein n=1 Tax=Clostridium botulinum TaxID=1491 RepID=UPI000773DC89|nr:hypothetical protein [Clostridium botulinum]AUM92350.1 hypothetical protein RSJ5_14090 [Clostridium botulinum]MBE1304748.1 hypothetical protein [Clostridium botulinum]NFB12427.1 hypothetical protein [Clostridium botulinum]NFH58370.1 hypothetical protein [Clostridium botulinum]NFJ85340.1 hypothetical protein [Clostridium botulinum]
MASRNEIPQNFANDMLGGNKQKYNNPIAISKNSGWRYSYENMFCVLLISQYLLSEKFDNAIYMVAVTGFN